MCMMCLKYRIILLIVIKNRGSFYSHIMCFGAPPRTPLGRLQRPSDPSTFPYSALHVPFRHLAMNVICCRAVATSLRKLQRKHRKMWRNATLFLMTFCVKNKGQTEKAVAQRSRIGTCSRIKIDAMIAAELGQHGLKSLKF